MLLLLFSLTLIHSPRLCGLKCEQMSGLIAIVVDGYENSSGLCVCGICGEANVFGTFIGNKPRY